MQIFVLNKNPKISAFLLSYIDFRRFNKQIVELGQILSTVARIKYSITNKNLYKACFMHHPIVLWTSKKNINFIWALKYLNELLKIFFTTRNKHHKTEIIYESLKKYNREIDYTKINFCRCFSNKNKYAKYDIFTAYKKYIFDKIKREFLLTGTLQTPHKITAPHLAENPHGG